MTKPTVFGFTFARGGSKGVPRKNTRPLGGKPLIAHAIEQALASDLIDRHYVSTDDEEIAAVATEHGARVPFMRPAELAQDTSPEILSWKHAIRTLREAGEDFDVMTSVPAVSPLRRPADIDRVVERLLESDADLVITVTPSERSPYFNMVQFADDETVEIVVRDEEVFRRQDAPSVYDIATVAYAARPDYVLGVDSLFDGVVRAVIVDRESAIDIDTELDFKFAEFLYLSGKQS